MLLFKMNVGFALIGLNDMGEFDELFGFNDLTGINELIGHEVSMLFNQVVESVAENIYNNDDEESGLTMSDFIKLCFILCSRSVIIC